MNARILNWFESGHVREALLGEGTYFIQDHTYRSNHDLILVISTLLQWASLPNNMTMASTSFDNVLKKADEMGNIVQMRDMLVSYDILSKELKIYLQIDLEFWREQFKQQLLCNIGKIKSNESWLRSIKEMRKRFPELKLVLERIKEK